MDEEEKKHEKLICKEFENKSPERILEILQNRNPNVINSELIACAQWIYSIVKD